MSRSFWNQIVQQEIIPKRATESILTYWKRAAKQGLERYLQEAVQNGERYSHVYKKRPRAKPHYKLEIYRLALERMLEASQVPFEQIQKRR